MSPDKAYELVYSKLQRWLEYLIAILPNFVLALLVIVLMFRSEFRGTLEAIELPLARTYPPLVFIYRLARL